MVRLTSAAASQAGSASAAQSVFNGSNVELRVVRGLGLPGQLLVATPELDATRVADVLRANPHVAHFEEDTRVGALDEPSPRVFPDEQTQSPLFLQQYGLDNPGSETADGDIDAPEAWSVTTGNYSVVVSVIDSGVDYTHPDLYLNIWLNEEEIPGPLRVQLVDNDDNGLITFSDLNAANNGGLVHDLNLNGYIDGGDLLDDPLWSDGIDTDENGFEDDLIGWDFEDNDNRPIDEHRHGTHVAGILGATGNNAFGVTGVAWATSIMPLRFLNENNTGDISDGIEAINYTTMMRTRATSPVNIRVSNNSWGFGSFSQNLFDAVDGNLQGDIVFVAAAGNGDVLGQGIDNDQSPFYPAGLELPNVISVAASDASGNLARFSNYGSRTVDIAAPGVGIVSTEPSGAFSSRDGTSMAAAFVSGTAALIYSERPKAAAVEVRNALLDGASSRPGLATIAESRALSAFDALRAQTFAPSAAIEDIPPIGITGGTGINLVVTYSDDEGVALGTLGVDDLEISRNGFAATHLAITNVDVVAIAGGARATYRVSALGGQWDATDNGQYVITLRDQEVGDLNGLAVGRRTLGDFEVSITDPHVFFVNSLLDSRDTSPGDGLARDDSGRTTLRAAIIEANASGASSTIVLPDGHYSLTIPGVEDDESRTGDLDVTGRLRIIGAQSQDVTIDGQGLDRVVDVQEGAVLELTGVSLVSGSALQGGGLRCREAQVSLAGARVMSNIADQDGGGVYNTGTLTIIDTTLDGNRTVSPTGKGGGGLYNAGAVTIQNSTLSQNLSAAGLRENRGGGALFNDSSGVLAGTNITISGNTATRGNGGGILNGGEITLSHATIVENSAPASTGGGVYNAPVPPSPVDFRESFGSNGAPPSTFVVGGLRFVTTDSMSRIIALDSLGQRVQVFDSAGNFLFAAGRPGEGNGEFIRPVSVAVDLQNHIHVLDQALDRIQEFDASGQFVGSVALDTSAGLYLDINFSAATGLLVLDNTGQIRSVSSPGLTISTNSGAQGFDVDANGNLYVQSPLGEVTVYSATGGPTRHISASGSGQGQLGVQFSVSVAANGEVYVAEVSTVGTTRTRLVQVFNSSGQFLRTFGVPDSSGNDGLRSPNQIHVGSDNRIYIADTGNSRVQVFSTTGIPNFRFGTAGRANTELSTSRREVEFEANGKLYVADQEFNRIQVFTADRQKLLEFGKRGNQQGEFNEPSGIAVDATGQIFVGDKGNHRVQVFTAQGQFVRSFGVMGTGNGQFTSPTGIDIDTDGEVFVVDEADRIQVFSGTGTFLRTFGVSGTGSGQLNNPQDIELLSDGAIVVSDSGNNRLQFFNQTGASLRTLGSSGTQPGQFVTPLDISIGDDGRLYVTDSGNSRIQVFDINQNFLYAVAATGLGPGQFSGGPRGVAAGPGGEFFVTDLRHDGIQTFGPAEFPGGVLTIQNSIVALNQSFRFAAEFDVSDRSLSATISSTFLGTGGADPQLGPLAENGGATRTHAPLIGSPVVDAADDLLSTSTDQTGHARPVDGGDGDGVAHADQGSVELSSGEILGTYFVDLDGDGRRGLEEPGLSGRVMYVDLNGNRRLDPGEPQSRTRDDDPTTVTNEEGTYSLRGLAPGLNAIREVASPGYDPTFPLRAATGQIEGLTFTAFARSNQEVTIGGQSTVTSLSTFSEPALRSGQLAFVGNGVGILRTSTPDELNVVVEEGGQLEGLRGQFSELARTTGGLRIDGQELVFDVRTDRFEIAILRFDASGRLSVIAREGENIPNGIGVFSLVKTPRPDDGIVLFEGRDATDSQIGKYLATRDGQRTVVRESTIDAGTEPLPKLSTAAAMEFDGNRVAYADPNNGVAVVSLHDLDAVQVIANLNTPIPSGTGNFMGFELAFPQVAFSGNIVAFPATGNGQAGIYASNLDSNVRVVADLDTAIPGGPGNFMGFDSHISVFDQQIAFVGHGASDYQGIYIDLGNGLQQIIDTLDELDGKTPRNFAIGPQSLEAGALAFRAEFTDGTSGIYVAGFDLEPRQDVTVEPARVYSGLDFGSRPLTGTISGAVFEDVDGNGVRGSGDPPAAGQTVFLDRNRNGQLDDGEHTVITTTNGSFQFDDLPSLATYSIGLRPTSNFVQTVPTFPGQRLATVNPGELVLGVSFAVSRNAPTGESGADGVLRGTVFSDLDGDGLREAGEPGRGGVTVYIDENGDARFNGGERSIVTSPDGRYEINELRGSRHAIRIVVPNGTMQLTPLGNAFTTSTVRTVDTPSEIVAADFDGDGDDDLATTISEANEVLLFANDGAGNLLAGSTLREGLGSGPSSLAVGRFQGSNSLPGLVVGHSTSNTVIAYVSDGLSGLRLVSLVRPVQTLAGGPFASLGNAPYVVTTGDFDRDGDDDVAVASQNGGAVTIFRSGGNGTFSHEQTLILPRLLANSPIAITSGDVNGDGHLDLATANLVTNNVTILRNTGISGAGRFAIASHEPTNGRLPLSVRLGDLDGDGDNDLVTTNLQTNNVSVLLNVGSGTFAPGRQLPVGIGPAFATITDVDQDGRNDILYTTSDSSNRFGILRNRGGGEFQAPETSGLGVLPDGTLAFALAMGQFNDDNGDGAIDLHDQQDVAITNRPTTGSSGGVDSLTLGLNRIIPGAIRADLTPQRRTAEGLDFALRNANQPPTLDLIPDLPTLARSAAIQRVDFTGASSGLGEIQAFRVTASSSNTAIVSSINVQHVTASPTGFISFTPTPGRSGFSDIGVTVSDAGLDGVLGNSDDRSITRTFRVTVSSLDNPPRAINEAQFVPRNAINQILDVLKNEIDADPPAGQNLTLLFARSSSGGNVELTSDARRLRYTPAVSFLGTETIRYGISNGGGFSEATVSVHVANVVTLSVDSRSLAFRVTDGHVEVLRNGLRDPAFVSVAAADVGAFSISGNADSNLIDLSAITPTAFSLVTGVQLTVTGGAGNDTLIGSGFADVLRGAEGADDLQGGSGNDTIDGGTGSDVLAGAGGSDSLTGGTDADMLRETADFNMTVTNTALVLSLSGFPTVTDVLNSIELLNLTGGPSRNRIDASGFGGSSDLVHRFIGAGGRDTILGTNARDLITTFSSGADLIHGLGGDDSINAGNGNDTIDGGAGNDTVLGQNDDDSILGGSENDVLLGNFGLDVISGGAGTDRLFGLADNDRLTGDTENDSLFGGDGDDNLNGGSGNDLLRGEMGTDVFDGGSGGSDRIDESGDTSFTVIGLQISSPMFGTETARNIERFDLQGGPGNNRIDASQAAIMVILNGLGGSDTLKGGSSPDILSGGDGGDTISGGGGDDQLTGGRGNDSLDGGVGALDRLKEQEDTDFVVLSQQLSSPALGTDSLLNVERFQLAGGPGANSIDASQSSVAVTIEGLGGNDTINGGTVNDTLFGGDGGDILSGGNGNDVLHGQDGDDSILGDAGDDVASGGNGQDTINGGTGNDGLAGRAGNDQLIGFDGNDTILGGEGHDTLLGAAQNDILLGGEGDDYVDGQGGSFDTVAGGNGNDDVRGSATEIDEAFVLDPAILSALELD